MICTFLIGGVAAALAAFPGDNGRIAFQTDRNGHFEIAVINPDGAGFRSLPLPEGIPSHPAWSADGKKIAFSLDSGGSVDLYVLTFGSMEVTKVFGAEGVAAVRPAFSPDGLNIVFEGIETSSGLSDVWAVNVETKELKQLTIDAADVPANDGEPAWAPDDSKIAFVTDRDGNREIYLMKLDGSDQTNLTQAIADDGFPNWSPDGAQIVFQREGESGSEIWTMKAEVGSAAEKLADGMFPAFSPAGDGVAYVGAVDGDADLFFVNVGGGEPLRLTSALGQDLEPDWQPVNPDGNLPPEADAGSYGDVECTSPDGASAVLDGSGSSDADSTEEVNDIVLYEWFENYGESGETFLGDGVTLERTLSIGDHFITLQVTDSVGQSAREEVLISVVDTVPPEITVVLTPARIWPPNHKMVPIHAIVVAKDQCTVAEDIQVLLLSVTSNEPDDGNGDGNTVDDIQGADTGTADFDFWVRAERAGGGSGRVYTATYEATDAADNSAEAFGVAKVPHDQGKGTNGSDKGRGVKKNPRN